jgi:hypothetical protein
VVGTLLALPPTLTIILICARVAALERVAVLRSGGPDDPEE